MRAYDILGKMKWKDGLENCRIIIRHRGEPGDEKRVAGCLINEIKRSYLVYKEREEVVIPMHRILRIESDDSILWKKSGT